ncbi:MAG: hypothetical protein AB7L84_14415 [Acidimicrobiia bacterium]
MQVFASDPGPDDLTLDPATVTDLSVAVSTLRDIGPDLRAALSRTADRLDVLAAGAADQRAETADLGRRLNLLLDRPAPPEGHLAEQLEAQDQRLARLHDLLERLHAVVVTEPANHTDDLLHHDLAAARTDLGTLGQRLDRLEAQMSLLGDRLNGVTDATSRRVGEVLTALGSLRGERLEPLAATSQRTEAELVALRRDVAAALSDTASRTESEIHRMRRDVSAALRDPALRTVSGLDELRHDLAAALARPAPAPEPAVAEVDPLPVVEAVAERTEAGLAAMLRLIDQRLDRLTREPLAEPAADPAAPAPGTAPDPDVRGEGLTALAAAVDRIDVALAGLGQQQALLVDLLGTHRDVESAEADTPALDERVTAQLEGLMTQMAAVGTRVEAVLAELERRQPRLTGENLKKAAASVRDVVAATSSRRPRRNG